MLNRIDRRLRHGRALFRGTEEPHRRIRGGPIDGLALTVDIGPIAERSILAQHRQQAVGTTLESRPDLFVGHVREGRDDVLQFADRAPWDQRRGGLFQATVRVVEEEIRGTRRLAEG